MKTYNIYSSLDSGDSSVVVKVVQESFSVLGGVFGPVMFVFYGMWKEFFIYLIFVFLNSALYMSEITTFGFYQVFYIVSHLYIGFDFFNKFDLHLLAKGYFFKARILAFNKLDAESRYVEQS